MTEKLNMKPSRELKNYENLWEKKKIERHKNIVTKRRTRRRRTTTATTKTANTGHGITIDAPSSPSFPLIARQNSTPVKARTKKNN